MSDRPNALEVLAHHWPKPLASCLCGWAELGKSHSGHQVEMLRAAVGATEGQPVVLLGDGTLTVAVREGGWVYVPTAMGNRWDHRLHYDDESPDLASEDAISSLWRIPGAES